MPSQDKAPPLSRAKIRSLLRTARHLAETTGQYVRRRHRGTGQRLEAKGVGDFVTAVDLGAEELLRRKIRAAHPEHGILGEEAGSEQAEADLIWILDPIDGTSNFGNGLSIYAVSVACLHRGQPVAAAMFCMPEACIWSAGLGLGAWQNRRRVQMRPGRLDDQALLAVQWHRGPRRLAYLPALLATGSRIRNLGCTVVQLCDLVAGRLDANLQEQGKIWDIAAAGLLVEEAGGRFTDWSGKDIFPLKALRGEAHYPSLAAHPEVHRRLRRLLIGKTKVPPP